MKSRLKIINAEFKNKTLESLESEKNDLISCVVTNKEEYLTLNLLQRLVVIGQYVINLSFYADKEVLDLIKSLGLISNTPKIFVNHKDLFQALDTYQKQSNYLYPLETIWGFYKLYSASVIKEKMALDFNLNLSKLGKEVNRQTNNKSFPPLLKKAIEDIKKLAVLIKKEIPNYKMPISEKNTLSSVVHMVRYSHKIDLHNLYMSLADFNKKAKFIDFYEPDFKCEFYDLLVIILREKELLYNSYDVQMTYSSEMNSRAFKIKRVNRLILSE